MRIVEKLQILNQLASDFAEAKGQEIQLTHFRKSQLAILKKQYLADNPKWSNAKCDDEARADDQYITVCKGLAEATKEKEKALWQLKNEHAAINLHQTLQADARAKLKIEQQMT